MSAPQSEVGQKVHEFLDVVCEGLGLDARVDIEEGPDELVATVIGEGLGLLIGRHGQTIDAVQHLAFKLAAKHSETPPRLVVDAAGYREKRRATLERQADEAAEQALGGAQPVALDVMGASERKLVHEYLKARGDVQTYSEGEEPNRHLVVAPLNSA